MVEACERRILEFPLDMDARQSSPRAFPLRPALGDFFPDSVMGVHPSDNATAFDLPPFRGSVDHGLSDQDNSIHAVLESLIDSIADSRTPKTAPAPASVHSENLSALGLPETIAR
jgi:hypothetical protein